MQNAVSWAMQREIELNGDAFMISRLSIVALSLAFISGTALAQVKMDGQFVASKACPAVVSIKKGTNPDNISVEAGKSYMLLGKNKDQATHYWVNVPGASPAQRWVALDCGSVDGAQASLAPAGGGGMDFEKLGGEDFSGNGAGSFLGAIAGEGG